MKLQGLSVIFCLIAVPIILVLTAYIQAQITTISMQLAYDTKLLDATHDAMVALEINTANEDLSTVSDSLRSIVSASTNTFINSLSANMGMSSASKSALQPYVPAILVTLYDGYYIYSPTKTPIVCTNSKGVAVYVGDKGVKKDGTVGSYQAYTYDESDTISVDEGADSDYGMLMYKVEGEDKYITGIVEGITEFKTDYVLKSYIPYASRYYYKTGANPEDCIDVQINYTLDNFINIYGNIEGIYYTKSGYYSNVEVTKCIVGDLTDSGVMVNPLEMEGLMNYNEAEIDEFIDKYSTHNKYISIVIDTHIDGDAPFTITSKYIDGDDDESNVDEYEKDDADSAIRYYLKSFAFSNWCREYLADLEIGHIKENMSKANEEAYGESVLGGNDNNVVDNISIVRFEGDTRKIFNSSENPEELDSTFSLHRTDVMKNSIQYNLNVAMSSYNEMNLNSFAFEMPILDDVTWDKITSKVSIVSFMQGFKCGLKTYNNYASVSSTNNEFTVIPEEIYYVGPNSTGVNGLNDGETKYHRIDCPEFSNVKMVGNDKFNFDGILESTASSDTEINDYVLERTVRSFVSKEVKYDKIYNSLEQKYDYDHQNVACYKCIVSRNYESSRDGKIGYYNNLDYKTLSRQAKKVYLIALAKERDELYKTNQIVLTQGMKVDRSMANDQRDSNPLTLENLNNFFNHEYDLKDIKSIEVTFKEVTSQDPTLAIVAYIKASANGIWIKNSKEEDGHHRLILNQLAAQTITLEFSNADVSDTSSLDSPLSILTIDLYSELKPDGSNIRASEGSIKYWIDSIKVNYK